MNTHSLKQGLVGLYTIHYFAKHYIEPRDLTERYSRVYKYMNSDSRVISRLARDLYYELLLDELSKIHYMDFSGFVCKITKTYILASNCIIPIDADDDDEILTLLKSLGEAKVLEPLFEDAFTYGNLTFKMGRV